MANNIINSTLDNLLGLSKVLNKDYFSFVMDFFSKYPDVELKSSMLRQKVNEGKNPFTEDFYDESWDDLMWYYSDEYTPKVNHHEYSKILRDKSKHGYHHCRRWERYPLDEKFQKMSKHHKKYLDDSYMEYLEDMEVIDEEMFVMDMNVAYNSIPHPQSMTIENITALVIDKMTEKYPTLDSEMVLFITFWVIKAYNEQRSYLEHLEEIISKKEDKVTNLMAQIEDLEQEIDKAQLLMAHLRKDVADLKGNF